ncbi:MAG: hypothetical protein ABIQ93_13790 [Saprospiraceae bacterium]
MKFVFFSWLIALALAGCGGQAKPAPRHLQCYVRFDAVQRQVQADATLHQGTDPQAPPVEMPGGMLYQGSDMHIIPLQGLTYRRIYAADFVPEHTFGWTDEKGLRQKVNFPMAAISRFTFGDKPLSRTQPAKLRWEGGALEKGEALTLIWENKALRQTVPMELITSGGDPFIEFPAAKIAELAPGQWTVYLVRKRLAKAKVNDLATEAVLEYYSKSDTIEVR